MMHNVPKDPDGHVAMHVHDPDFGRERMPFFSGEILLQFRRDNLTDCIPTTIIEDIVP